MFKRRLMKTLYFLVNHLPRGWRDGIYRSRLNFRPLPEEITIEIATSREDLDQAFQILHDAYVKEGFSKPHENGRRVTDYHILPSTSTAVAKYKGEVIGTISIIRDGAFGLPVDKVADLSPYREKGERLGEVSSLAIRPDYRGRSGLVMFYMFKYIVHYSLDCFGVDRFVIVVNPSRRALYESLLVFSPLKQKVVSSYQFANNAPGLCLTLNLRRASETWEAAYKNMADEKNLHRFFFGGFSEAEKKHMHFPERRFHTIEDPVMSPGIMSYFFQQCTDGLCGLSDRQIKMLQSIYREQAYEDIWPVKEGTGWRNKRSDRRFDVACTGLMRGRQPESIRFRVLDASRRGLRVMAETELEKGAQPRLSVAVGSQTSVALDTRTRWQKGNVYGLEIVSSGAFWERFIDYLEERRTRNASLDEKKRQDAEEITTAQ